MAALREHRRRQLAERLLMGAGFTDHRLVFCRPDGGPLHPERFSRTFVEQAAKAGTYSHVTEGMQADAAGLVAQLMTEPVSNPLADGDCSDHS